MSQITLPWPPSSLTPNAKRRSHWRAYQPATKAYRARCGWETLAQVGKGHRPTHLSVTFHAPDKRRRDLDGMLGAFKAGLDGIADALGVDDSEWSLSIAKGEPVKGGAVVVRIGGAE